MGQIQWSVHLHPVEPFIRLHSCQLAVGGREVMFCLQSRVQAQLLNNMVARSCCNTTSTYLFVFSLMCHFLVFYCSLFPHNIPHCLFWFFCFFVLVLCFFSFLHLYFPFLLLGSFSLSIVQLICWLHDMLDVSFLMIFLLSSILSLVFPLSFHLWCSTKHMILLSTLIIHSYSMTIEWNYQGSDIGKSNLCMKMKGLCALKENIKAVGLFVGTKRSVRSRTDWSMLIFYSF